MKSRSALLSMGIVLFAAVLFSIQAWAGGYPEKPINLYIPYSGGGTTDVTARLLTNIAQKDFATPLVCINKPGGGSALMHELIAKSDPDGYTLGVMVTAALTRIPFLRDVNYDPMNDFEAIMLYGLYQHGLCVKADSPWKTFEEFIAYAKENPNKVTYSTAGTGSGQHLVMEYLAAKEGIKWTHIPYKGGVNAVTACLGGHVTATSQATEWKSYVQAGQLRLLAVYGVKRIASFPDVRTLKEIGYDYALVSGMGIIGPKNLPDDVVKKVGDAFGSACQDKGFLKQFKKMDLLPYYLNQKELADFLKEDYAFKKDLIQRIGLGKK
ncbi:tripartite tricarboxylate transporter substrate binding protein [Desulfospira joergensenii]|uniref:tripartite tricarboxylate transporter substrate binding protein n=1 Tax=Desulfospira joergensenii TaxID=53329 RepID=UPI00040C7ECD|nr:tripartite tricarboxylate transporter substrate binding protein [Desulfospira joergensenii]